MYSLISVKVSGANGGGVISLSAVTSAPLSVA
jgi:hypothetical protein